MSKREEEELAIIMRCLSQMVAEGVVTSCGLNAEGKMVYCKRSPPWAQAVVEPRLEE
jgi:hypothetical protein